MFLHLGADTIIPLKDVIAISQIRMGGKDLNNEFLKKQAKKKEIVNISEGEAKSMIITENNIYLSSISAPTLKKRGSLGVGE